MYAYASCRWQLTAFRQGGIYIAHRVSHLSRRPSSCAFVPALVLRVPINGATTCTGTHDSGISDTGYLAHPCSGVVWCRAAPLISASRVSLSALLLNSSIALLLLPFTSSSAPLLLHSLPDSPTCTSFPFQFFYCCSRFFFEFCEKKARP